jgi:hypothetical protein
VVHISRRVGTTGFCGSDGLTNMTGTSKLNWILARCPRFDYVGNSPADLPLWDRADHPFAVNAGPMTLWRARRRRPDLVVLTGAQARFRTWIQALRVHQWAKNVLLVLPIAAAHLTWTWVLLGTFIAGFIAFSLAASAVSSSGGRGPWGCRARDGDRAGVGQALQRSGSVTGGN